MAHPKPDFTIKWGTLDEPIAPIADIDQNNGWSFLGSTPPTAAQFDYMMALYDKRDAWLEEQIPSAGTTSYIRTLLDDSSALLARQTLGLGSIVQTTGSSTTDIMSQKSVTDNLIGVNQIWQDLTGSRSKGVTYTNTTGKPIKISVTCTASGSSPVGGTLTVSGINTQRIGWASGEIDRHYNFSEIIPDGDSYQLSGASLIIQSWSELR